MENLTLNKVTPPPTALESKLNDLLKKEQKVYEALATLINFLSGQKKIETKFIKSFLVFKKEVVAAVRQFEPQHKKRKATHEPKFNVKHYERAIMCASNPSYRDMAIQAASKGLNCEAMSELVLSLHRDCLEIGKKIKWLSLELRKMHQMRAPTCEPLQTVAEPLDDEESIPLPV